MKTFLVFSRLVALCITLGISLSSCFINLNSFDVVSGSGKLDTRERRLPPFTKVENGTSADVEITTKGPQKVELTTDDNLHEFFITEVVAGRLIISTKPGIYNSSQTTVFKISMPSLEETLNTGSGNFFTSPVESPTFTAKTTGSGDMNIRGVSSPMLSVTCTGSGDITVQNIVAQALTASGSGSGSLILSGTSSSGTLTLTGSGGMSARGLTVQQATARTSGSGSMQISVVQSLDATVTGSGGITYFGNPAVTRSVSGSGDVRKGN